MFDNMVTALVSLFRRALAALAGVITADDFRWDIPPAQGTIQEIDPLMGQHGERSPASLPIRRLHGVIKLVDKIPGKILADRDHFIAGMKASTPPSN